MGHDNPVVLQVGLTRLLLGTAATGPAQTSYRTPGVAGLLRWLSSLWQPEGVKSPVNTWVYIQNSWMRLRTQKG